MLQLIQAVSTIDGTSNDDEIAQREFARKEIEKNAFERLEKSVTKPVIFALRTNISFDGSTDDDAPVIGRALSFRQKEFIHIVEKYSNDWWIGRTVSEDAEFGFIPSPSLLEHLQEYKLPSIQVDAPGTATPPHELSESLLAPLPNTPASPGLEVLDDPNAAHNVMFNTKKKFLFKKQDTASPYETVPIMRPIVIVGPSLKGFEVTDMMQKGIFDFLQRKFHDRILIQHIRSDLSMIPRQKTTGKTGGNYQADIEKIFDLSREMKLLVLDCDTINHPSQLQKTSLCPIFVYIKIQSPKVLTRLIKSRNKSQKKTLHLQLAAQDKLAQCEEEMFDVILDENLLEEACDHLAEYLANYYKLTHQVVKIDKSGREKVDKQDHQAETLKDMEMDTDTFASFLGPLLSH